MAHPLHLRVLDLLVAVHGLDGGAAAQVSELWAAAAAAPAGRSGQHVRITVTGSASGAVAETAGGGRWACSGPAAATAAVSAAVNVTAVHSTAHLTLHAGVVAKGPVLLAVPAASGAGKSTLVCALVAAGWRYVSDEALVLRWDDSCVVPYPRPVGLSPWSWAAVGGAQRWTSVLAGGEHHFLPTGPAAADGPAIPSQVSVVLLPERADRPGLAPLRRADALSELVRRSFTLHRHPAAGHVLLADVLRRAEVGRLMVADPTRTADLLDGTLG